MLTILDFGWTGGTQSVFVSSLDLSYIPDPRLISWLPVSDLRMVRRLGPRCWLFAVERHG